MIYELNQLESWIAQPASGTRDQWEEEATRICQVMMKAALSHEKERQLQRYFRVHYDALQSILTRLKKQRSANIRQLYAVCVSLAGYMKEHFGQYLYQERLDPDDPDIDAQKVITTFSVSELGVIIRLFIETGAFRVRNRKALTRFMSRNVGIRSKQVPETFSENHLYNAIHTPDPQAMDRLQELLNQMLVKLHQLRRDQRNKQK